MKKLLLLSVVSAATISFANAQENRNLLVYADGAASLSNNAGRYFLNAGVGYKIDKKWTLGGSFSIADMSVAPPSLARAYSVGAFARYTESFGNENRFFWYVQGNAGYQYSRNENGGLGYANRDTWRGVSLSVVPGVGINLPRGFALTITPASISYGFGTRNSFGHKDTYGTLEAGLGRGTFSAAPVIGVMKNINTGHKRHTPAGERIPQTGK